MSNRPHIVDGEFQSDKYPTCPRGKVPLSVKDTTAQDLLWTYAQRRRAVDAEFSADLELALIATGFKPPPMKEHDKLVIRSLRTAIFVAWAIMATMIASVVIRSCQQCPVCPVPAEKP